ncbi:hypothetical protein LIER_34182 [Lithospermum erythrorhizon]|uniref:Transposase n=1 Tax=Lithospermum erythrorhizon TaxID=34254 RepID=A0AAV3RZL7_LITER
MTSLDDGLVQLKTQKDVDDMIRWAKGVREIGMFVAHPSRKLAKSLLLGKIYDSIRSKWPKATLKELDDDEAKLLGFKEKDCNRDGGYRSSGGGGQEFDEMEVQGGEGIEEVEVEGLQRIDTFLDDNNIVFEDYDCDTEAFMGEDNFGEDYEPIEEEKMEGKTQEAYNEIDVGACYVDEERMFEDLGPILNDISPLRLVREYVVTTKKPLKFTIDGNHTCGTSMKIPTISVKWLAKKYVNKFARLWSYAKEMLDIIPGSTIIIKQKEEKFQRIYVCSALLKRDFLVGCRRFVCLDGCFLKGAFKGQILAVVALDVDNGIYPVTWAVVEVENTDSWR